MTLIATLPAGRYAVLPTYQGDYPAMIGHDAMDAAKRVYVANYDEAMHRAARRDFRYIPGEDGLFDVIEGVGARVTLTGVEAIYDHADQLTMNIQLADGTFGITYVMVIVPAETMEHDRRGGIWRIVENDRPFDVRWSDLVLQVGDETYDMDGTQYYTVGMDTVIKPGDGVYELLGCASMSKGSTGRHVPISQALIDDLTAIGTPLAVTVAARAIHLRPNGSFAVYNAHVHTVDTAPIHLGSYHSDTVIRHGSPVYDLLSPQRQSDVMMVEGIGPDLLTKLEAIEGPESAMAQDTVRYFLKAKTGGRAYFTPWLDKLPLAA